MVGLVIFVATFSVFSDFHILKHGKDMWYVQTKKWAANGTKILYFFRRQITSFKKLNKNMYTQIVCFVSHSSNLY